MGVAGSNPVFPTILPNPPLLLGGRFSSGPGQVVPLQELADVVDRQDDVHVAVTVTERQPDLVDLWTIHYLTEIVLSTHELYVERRKAFYWRANILSLFLVFTPYSTLLHEIFKLFLSHYSVLDAFSPS